MADGLRNHQIAETLGLSVGTVKVHVNRILEKLDAVDRTEAVTRALRLIFYTADPQMPAGKGLTGAAIA
jgi:DNA-binding NarL/FixJ family response regulator